MAEDRKYTSRGISLASPGRLDFTNIQQSIRGSQTLQKRLDQVSDMAYGQMKKTAVREGKQYAVENRPSIQQISDAVMAGKNINELFEDPDTVFGDAARGVQAGLLYQDLMNEYTVNTKSVLDAVNRREIVDVAEVEQILNANKEGFAKVLGQIDPDYALKFRASASTLGFDVVDKARKHVQQETLRKTRFDIDTQLDVFKSTYASIIDRSPNPIDIEALTTVHESNLKGLFAQDIEKESAHLDKFKKIKREVLEDTVAKYIVSNNMMQDASKGNFGKYNALLLAEDIAYPGAIEQIKSKINKLHDTEKTLINKQKEENNRINEFAAAELIAGNSQGFLTDDQLFTELDKLGYEMSAKEKESILSDGVATIQQQDEYASLELQVNLGKIGPSDIDEARLMNLITYKQAAELKTQYNKTQTTLKAGNDIIYKTFRIDELELKATSRDDPTRALIAQAQDELDKRRDFILEQQKQDPSIIFNQREEARNIAEQVKGEYIQSQAPAVFNILNGQLRYFDDYYNNEAAIMTLTEGQVKDMVMQNDKISKKNKVIYTTRIIDNLRKLKAYKLGVIPSEK
jgi:hypothetical protein